MDPTLEDRQRAESTLTSRPSAAGSARGGRAGRDGLKESVRSMGYEEGARALSPSAPEDAKQPSPAAEEARKATELAGYEQALGRMVGARLYGLISKEVSPEQVRGYGVKALDGLFGLVAKQVEKGGGGGKDGAPSVDDFKKACDAEAQELMASPAGQALAQKLSTSVGAHPYEVVGAIVLAAAAAVAANVSIPELKQKFALGGGVEAEVSAKLGKIRALSLEAVAATLKAESGKLAGEVGVERDEKGKVSGHVAASYGDDSAKVETRADIDAGGLMTARVGAKGRTGSVEGSAGASYSQEQGTSADAKVSWGGKEQKVTGGAQYNFAKRSLTLELGDEFKKDLGGGPGTVGLSGAVTNDRNGLAGKTSAKYTTETLTTQLNAAFSGATGPTVGASVDAHPKSGMLYGVQAEVGLRDEKLLSYGAHFGVRDPEQFRGFLLEYKHTNAASIPEDQFKATVETTIDKLMVRVHDETTLRNGSLSAGSVSALAAYPINKDLALIGGVTQGYGPNRTVGTMPQVGVQVKGIPVTVGYDVNSKAWNVGITIPFGR